MLAIHLCVIIKNLILNLLTDYSPEGTYAVITKHGELHDIRKTGGIYFCLPWVYSFPK